MVGVFGPTNPNFIIDGLDFFFSRIFNFDSQSVGQHHRGWLQFKKRQIFLDPRSSLTLIG